MSNTPKVLFCKRGDENGYLDLETMEFVPDSPALSTMNHNERADITSTQIEPAPCFIFGTEVARASTITSNRNTSTSAAAQEEQPLCPVHRSLEERDALEVGYGNNCIACSLNERQELLDLLAPFAAPDASEDTVTVLRRLADFWNTHQGENRVVVSYPASAAVTESELSSEKSEDQDQG